MRARTRETPVNALVRATASDHARLRCCASFKKKNKAYQPAAFPEWTHELVLLPDSFACCRLAPVRRPPAWRWFCTHTGAECTNPFPHDCSCGRCGAELLTLSPAPIGSDGDPVPSSRYRWSATQSTGCAMPLAASGWETRRRPRTPRCWKHWLVAKPAGGARPHATAPCGLPADWSSTRATAGPARTTLHLGKLHRLSPVGRIKASTNRSLTLLREADLVGTCSGHFPLQPLANP